jgi:hypothetical protein
MNTNETCEVVSAVMLASAVYGTGILLDRMKNPNQHLAESSALHIFDIPNLQPDLKLLRPASADYQIHPAANRIPSGLHDYKDMPKGPINQFSHFRIY